MNKSEFVPKLIGLADSESYTKIHGLYAALVERLISLKCAASTLFDVYPIPLSEVIDILQKNRPDLEYYLKSKFVSCRNISLPYINTEALISSGMLELPDAYARVIQHCFAINELREKITTTYFYIPISSLYIEEVDDFVLTEEFEVKLRTFTTTYTENEDQNIALEAVQRYLDATNDLIELGIVKSLGDSWIGAGDKLRMGVVNTKLSTRPLSPDPKIFNRYYPLAIFGEQKKFNGRCPDRNAIMC